MLKVQLGNVCFVHSLSRIENKCPCCAFYCVHISSRCIWTHPNYHYTNKSAEESKEATPCSTHSHGKSSKRMLYSHTHLAGFPFYTWELEGKSLQEVCRKCYLDIWHFTCHSSEGLKRAYDSYCCSQREANQTLTSFVGSPSFLYAVYFPNFFLASRCFIDSGSKLVYKIQFLKIKFH